MCWRQLVLIGLLVSSCREIEPVSPGQVFSGYQINGIVTNASGIPLEGIELRLFYEYGVRYPAQDTAQLFVSDSVNTIQAEVFDGEARLVRSFSIARFTGYLRRKIWDEKDSTSQSVKSGLYTIIVYFNGVFVKQYRWLIEGNVSAMTDLNGQFSIPKSCLPIGEIVDLYDPQGNYADTFDIIAVVDLVIPNVPGYVSVPLTRDQITRVTIIL